MLNFPHVNTDKTFELQSPTLNVALSMHTCKAGCDLSKQCNSVLTLNGVIDAKVGSPVDEDALHRNTETIVKTSWTVSFEYFPKTVAQSGEFPLRSCLADVCSQTSASKI